MSINVIQKSTEEQMQETMELFEMIKPLLDKGYVYSAACRKVKGITNNHTLNRKTDAWFRELVKYGESQGYSYKDYSGKRKMKK